MIGVSMRLAGILVAAGVAMGGLPAVAGVARPPALSAAATILGLAGALGFAARVATRLRQRRESVSR